MRPGIDAEPDVALREACAKAFDDEGSGVVLRLKTKNQLDFSTIVLPTERCEICLKLRLGVIKGLENGDSSVRTLSADAFLGKLPDKPCRNQGVEAA